VAPVLNEILDSRFLESLIKFIADLSEKDLRINDRFDTIKSLIEVIILPMMKNEFFQADFQV
jgi:hypothetical protein